MKSESQNKPIFLSGMWHSRMTSLWLAFREHEEFTCLYAPLQSGMATITRKWIGSDTSALNEIDSAPRNIGDKSLYAEYLYHIKSQGIPHYSRKISDYCFTLKPDEEFDELKLYIASLLEFASSNNKIPVFGFYRMVFRLGWLAHNFEGHIIHVNSEPIDLWIKCLKSNSKTLHNWFRILEKNKEYWVGHLGKNLNLRRGMDRYLVNEESFYRDVLEHLSRAESYSLIYSLWLKSIYEALYHANLIIDTAKLESAAYIADTEKTLEEFSGQKIDLLHFDTAEEQVEHTINTDEIELRIAEEFAYYLKHTDGRDALTLLKSDLSHLSIKTQKRLAKVRDALEN